MKPMLAVDAPEKLQYPLYASPKLDGIRCVIKDNQAVSRTLKKIPNKYIQQQLGSVWLTGLDGEITVGPSTDANVMQTTTSGVMSREGEPDFTFWVFDTWPNPDDPFEKRLTMLREAFKNYSFYRDVYHVELLEQVYITNSTELMAYEEKVLNKGYEGLILRAPNSPYKYGRSTAKQGYLLKLKRFLDGEAIIVGFKERMHNANEAKLNALGYTERSTHKANMKPMGMLGALIVRDCKTNIEFDIGTGFSDSERRVIWGNQDKWLGHITKYKSFHLGVKDKPRFPVWLGMRHKEDM